MKISLITAVYNNRETIAHTLDSALAQDHPNVELIVIDVGSIDGTLQVLRGYADRLAVLVSGPDRGIYDALKRVSRAPAATWWAFCIRTTCSLTRRWTRPTAICCI